MKKRVRLSMKYLPNFINFYIDCYKFINHNVINHIDIVYFHFCGKELLCNLAKNIKFRRIYKSMGYRLGNSQSIEGGWEKK